MSGITVGQDRQVFIDTIKDLNGNVVDPATLTLEVRKPGAAVTTYTYPTDVIIVRDSVGNFHANLTLDIDGIWEFNWTATGPDYADGGTFYVNPKYTANPIVGQ